MRAFTRSGLATAIAATLWAGVAAGLAHADPDTDFSNELHTYGVYGSKDYNAWIAKIQCKRLRTGLDVSATKAATFLHTNLPSSSSEQQTYQFLSASINYYCPDQRSEVDSFAFARTTPSSTTEGTDGAVPQRH